MLPGGGWRHQHACLPWLTLHIPWWQAGWRPGARTHVKDANLGLGFRARLEGAHSGLQHEALQGSGRLCLPDALMEECHIRPWGCRYLQCATQSWTLLTCLLAQTAQASARTQHGRDAEDSAGYPPEEMHYRASSQIPCACRGGP